MTSPTASSATTSTITSPSSGTASSLNSTAPALALATALLSLSTTNCTDPGGGCAVLSHYLQNLTTDPQVCADDVILSAQVCALCGPTGETVGVYNVFVGECASEGLSNSTGTIGVGAQGSAATSGSSSGSAFSVGESNSGGVVTAATATVTGAVTGAVTGVVTGVITSAGSTGLASITSGASATTAASSASSASASATSVAGTTSGGGSSSSASNTGVQANEQSKGSITVTASLSGSPSSTIQLQTAADFAQEGGTGGTGGTSSGVFGSSVLSSSVPTSSALVSPATGTSSNALLTAQVALSSTDLSATATLSSLATQSSAAITTNTSALNASESFFALQVSSSCTSDCSTWQSLASSCTDDTCICTDSALTSAASCSSCVGATGQSDELDYTIQMAAYSQYQGNCSEEATLNPSASGSSNAIEVVASAGITNPSGSAVNANASATGTVVAQDAEQTVVVTSLAGRRVKQWMGNRSAGRAVILGLLWIGVARW